MHVGLVIYGSLDTLSGGYLYDRQVAHYLQGAGDTVEIIALPWRSYGRHLFDNGSSDLQTLLLNGGYDILLQDELNHPSLFWLNATMRERPMPIVSIVHHLRCSEARPAWQNSLYRRVEQRYLRSVDGFICNSRTTAAAVQTQLTHEMHAVIAYPGHDHLIPHMTADAVARRSMTGGPLRLLFVGNIIRRKGLDVVLEAVGQLQAGTWSLDIVGDDSIDPALTREILRLINGLPAGAHVTKHGRLDDAALAQQYAAAQVLVVPSTYEGYGIVYAEALGNGLPVIATTAGAAGEVIDDGVSGHLIRPGDAAELARKLAVLHDDRQWLAKMSVQALHRFQELPTWDESAERIRRFMLAEIARHREA